MAWFSRKSDVEELAERDAAKKNAGPARVELPPESVVATRAFPKFLTAVSQKESPVIVDFGPVIGSNVTFFGERLGCKLFVEDLFGDVEQHAKQGRRDALAEFFATRLKQEEGSVDGVLAWDLFDFLDRPAATVLAARIAKLVAPGGAVFGYFGAAAADLAHYTRFIIADEQQFKLKPYPASPVKRQVLQNRDIIKMFDPLTVAESFLLKSNTRETLFRRL